MGDTRFEIRKSRVTGTELICQLWDEPVSLMATDMSPAGLFIRSDLLLEVGEPVVSCFKLPGHFEEFQMFGEVSWTALPRRADDFGLAGMGIQFVKTRAIERLSIRSTLGPMETVAPYKSVGTALASPAC